MNVQKNNGEIKKIISVIGYANKDKLSKKNTFSCL